MKKPPITDPEVLKTFHDLNTAYMDLVYHQRKLREALKWYIPMLTALGHLESSLTDKAEIIIELQQDAGQKAQDALYHHDNYHLKRAEKDMVAKIETSCASIEEWMEENDPRNKPHSRHSSSSQSTSKRPTR